MTLFPWNAMNYDDPSGRSACWLDPFHMIMSSKFPTTYYTTMRCDLCLVIAVCFRKDLFTFCLRCSTPTISHFHLFLSTKYFEFYFMIGESCLQVDTLWGNFCWMAGDSQKCILIYSACFRYILSSLSSFCWEICWDPVGCYVIIYTVWIVVKKFAMCPFDIDVIMLCLFVCVGCFSRWTSAPPCEGKMCEQELVFIRRHCRPWRSDRSP